jgi:hypothetical protein
MIDLLVQSGVNGNSKTGFYYGPRCSTTTEIRLAELIRTTTGYMELESIVQSQQTRTPRPCPTPVMKTKPCCVRQSPPAHVDTSSAPPPNRHRPPRRDRTPLLPKTKQSSPVAHACTLACARSSNAAVSQHTFGCARCRAPTRRPPQPATAFSPWRFIGVFNVA